MVEKDDAIALEESDSTEDNENSEAKCDEFSDSEYSDSDFEHSKVDASVDETQDLIEECWLSQEHCDFLSDFGRSEPFLLDGDALMMHSIANSFIDWRNGGQFLHMVYIVEQFLAQLWSRGANFDIFFLMQNDYIFQRFGPSYDLGRNILVHHLRSSDSGGKFPLQIHLVSGDWFSGNNSDSTPWQGLVTTFRPAFIMTNSACTGPSLASVAQRWFCHQQLLRGSYVVVLQELNFEGSRVKGFLYSYPDPKTAAKMHEAMQPLKAKIDQQFREGAASSLFSDPCEVQSEVGPDEPPAEALCRESLFVQSLRSILAEHGRQPLTKSFAAVACACMHAIQSSPLAARALALPGDSEGIPALDAWGGPPAVAGAASAFLDSLYACMSERVRHTIARGTVTSGGAAFADVFDGRLFAAVALHAAADGGALPQGLADGTRRLLLAAWPADAGDCPPLQALLAPLAEEGAEPARAALGRAATAVRDGQRGLESASLLPASGTLLKEVLGGLSERLAPYESADDPLPLSATATGPFRAHNYHSTRPLEDEPDSFSYDLWDFQKEKRAEGRRDAYWARKQERSRLRNLQLKARAATRYQESLLAGSPCQRQTISQKFSEEDLEERRARAVKTLLEEGLLKRAPGGAGEGSGTGRRGGKAQGRGEKPPRAATTTPLSKKDKIIQDNLAAQQKKRLEKEMAGFESYKEQLSKLKDKEVLKYLEKMEELASKSEETALAVRMHCLETAAMGCPASCRQRTVYLLSQGILRRHLTQMTAQDKAKVAEAALGEGFSDLHAALLGPQAARAAAPRGRSRPDPAAAQSSILFQLERVPEHLLRPIGDGPDARVQFPPDAWQRKLLDTVDSGNSALVVAPTASGKTFISYYVMEMCLRAGDDGVVVYVAPTKALVNQVRAEIDARFDKSYRGSRKLSATFTRDFRDEGMLSAQILVTVPACLGILMLNSVEWASRIRHVIFDEVHSLGDSGGEVWEQLILLVDCPFLALSATVGNVQHFHAWLARVEAARGREVVLVEHGERYNDLAASLWGGQGAGLVPFHPCWVLHRLRMGRRLAPDMFPKDFRLLPEHCTSLYRAMAPLLPAKEARALDPETFFRGLCGGPEVLWVLSMRQVAAWEQALRLALCELEADAQDVVLDGLSRETGATFAASDVALAELGESRYVRREINSLLRHLKRADMLPGICFMLDRLGCERLAWRVTAELRDLEKTQRAANGWLAKRDRLRAERAEALQRYKKCKETAVILHTGEIIDPKEDLWCRYVELSNRLYQHQLPDPDFSFGNTTEDAIEDAFGKLRPGEHWTQLVPDGLMGPLLRGVAVHHAGMPKKYRQAVERLFRAKRLGVVFATATLALGINMPAKSSVFVSDAVYLNAMNFRQMAGRAGRRGFDLRGHVVFLGMPSGKCFRLMRSDLPKLHGNLVLSNSMALRLIIRQSALARLRPRDEEAYQRGVRACWRLVNLPLFDPTSAGGGAAGGGMMGAQMAHAFRFAVEYLQRMGLVRVDGAGETEPNDLAAFIAHLFFMEPANFAFVSLLLADDGRLFQRLCRPGPRRDETVLSVLCHVFMRSPLPASLAARARQRGSTSGPSVVLLPDLSAIGDKVKCPGGEEVSEGELVRRALCSKQALRSLEAYCACFASAHAAELGDDDTLPVSGRRLAPQPGCGGAAAADLGPLLGPLVIRPRVRSAFAGLSGHGDRFGSVDELCSTLRAGLYLDPQTVPVFELRPTAAPLNAYILDFFKHGQIRALVRYNRIRRDVVFEDLRSFALLLKALHAATARRAGTASAFAHPHVLDALESISRRFNEQLREASA